MNSKRVHGIELLLEDTFLSKKIILGVSFSNRLFSRVIAGLELLVSGSVLSRD
jgi:hypothetical protein